ncbi:FG-GAP-like repeat-containing protein [Seonamhaeicola marinus]|uniref:T9SS type A sorting domain-containing protein n=1 Tax=Seonamhaeicola marinus TaxID=1912246 RepID=A0A5D0HTP4_9FLAO|nr:FG-GAP-like repeat-containing protein [Seonamhaeicola marinus]TYA74763.1 T9SS type A sorting domain-containing protein [Seonamhaeicola marinus]
MKPVAHIHYLLIVLFYLTITHLQAQQIFIEKSDDLGINHYATDPNAMGGGVAIFDFNNDGFEDIYLIGGINDDKLYENMGDNTFKDVTVEKRISFFSLVKTMGVVTGDIDNDGYSDLFITTAENGHCYLLKNEQGKSFKDISIPAGITHESWSTTATMADYDLDGDLDIYVGNYVSYNALPFEDNITNAERDFFYQNNGNGTFTKIENPLREEQAGCTLVTSFSDFDQDGDPDLFVLNDFGDFYQSNKLLSNNFPLTDFNEITDTSNMNAEINSMGIATGDFNEDGNFDYYITNIGHNILYQGNNNHIFINTSDIEKVNDGTGVSWGTAFLDVNNDSYLDLLVAKGTLAALDIPQKNKFYLRNNQGVFEDMSEIQMLDDPNRARGMSFGDLNNDGKPDLIVCNIKVEPENQGGTLVYLNNNKSAEANWVKVSLQGVENNKNAYGSIVKAYINNRQLIREVSAGQSYLSQYSPTAHFGLGNATKIDSIVVEWPGKKTKNVHKDLDINQTYKIIENGAHYVLESLKLTLPEGESAFLEGAEQTQPGIYRDTILTASPKLIRITKLDFDSDSDLGNDNSSQYSVARQWNELLLESIRNDYARPTVHARNLFHISLAMYEAFSAYNQETKPYFLGNTVGNYKVDFNGIASPNDIQKAQEEAMSYACYRLLNHRFKNSPGYIEIRGDYTRLMLQLGYEPSFISTDYSDGNAAALGNYIAEQLIAFGLQDGSNEIYGYKNTFYEPKNEPLIVNEPGNPTITYPNNWQPLSIRNFIDQSGNVIGEDIPDFLSPEWGEVIPFALANSNLTIHNKDGENYWIYHNPGKPSLLEDNRAKGLENAYKWGFSMVSVWSSHLDPSDGKMIDISPASIGNVQIDSFPETFQEYQSYYKFFEGGDIGKGHSVNPVTGIPYTPQMVPRGDYARVLAEFWADGPDSETPPGHWFTILNYVNDHPLMEKKFSGKGNLLSDLEWDVKSYFLLAGAMHDAAITAWSIKGYYDYIRPISAIRYMASKGQDSDQNLINYHPEGIPLIPGYIEIVKEGDLLAGANNEHVGDIKLYAWKGTHFINNPDTDEAGVDWILAENWVPYQRPSFVTPPFAGYVSGHSTFSRAAAKVLTLLTGSSFFPGGMGVFNTEKNEFLVFEDGPSIDLTLQWATYQDASDQCSLSRIWGGIHPPIDDVPGRVKGEVIGNDAYIKAVNYFYEDKDQDGYFSFEDLDDNDKNIGPMNSENITEVKYSLYPIPVKDELALDIEEFEGVLNLNVFDIYGKNVLDTVIRTRNNKVNILLQKLTPGAYILTCTTLKGQKIIAQKIIKQ